MPNDLFEKHKPTLQQAVEAIHTRNYWSPFPETPSPKIYGETANDDGRKAFEARLERIFALDQPGTIGETGQEESPFGIGLAFAIQSPMSTHC